MQQQQETIALLGASRGLGWALAEHLGEENLLLVARRPPPQEKFERLKQARFQALDLAAAEQVEQILFPELSDFDPHRIVYLAGGGPYGPYGGKEWKDHLWAYQLSLLTPARLIHWVLKSKQMGGLKRLQQLVFVGSAVAEDRADPGAASYASAKHGLKGLIRSLQAEPLDIRLFSPGYMNTQMLPPNAWPRQQGERILEPEAVAQELWTWCQGLARLSILL